MTDIKTLFEPLNDWSKVEDCISDVNEKKGFTEYIFIPKDEKMEFLTYYKGGDLDGTLTIEPSVKQFINSENWEDDLSKHFTNLTGLPVKKVSVWE